MSIHQTLFACYQNPLRIVDAADFDGTNDFMARGADLTGNADSKKGLVSIWYRPDAGNNIDLLIYNTSGFGVVWYDGGADKFFFAFYNSAATPLLQMGTASTYAALSWYHVLASWDLAASATHLYINDVSDKSVSTGPVNDTIDYTRTNYFIGGTTGPTDCADGQIAEVYFAPGQYLDLSLVANRRRFISGSGKPVHLGTNGSLPTGTAPLVYQHIDDGEAVANFATNRGTGGDFTITGTLSTGSNSPSD